MAGLAVVIINRRNYCPYVALTLNADFVAIKGNYLITINNSKKTVIWRDEAVICLIIVWYTG